MSSYHGLIMIPLPDRAQVGPVELGRGAHPEPATGYHAWRTPPQRARRCRGRGARRPCPHDSVAELNRGQTDWDGRHGRRGVRRDAWWGYCAGCLFDYNRAVIDGAVWWLGVDHRGHSVAGYWRDRPVPERG